MDDEKKKKLEAASWRVGDADEFVADHEHVHEWGFGDTNLIEYRCSACGLGISKGAALLLLNEYETLKAATEMLSAEDALDIVYGISETLEGAKPRFEEEHIPILRAYANILERDA